jgi:hypothetical protein
VSRTPGFIIPSSFPNEEKMIVKLRELNEKAGFTQRSEDLQHSYAMREPELVHYGIKGMKWGVRRAEMNKPNPGYSSSARKRDAFVHPAGAVKRINKRMNKGADLKTARKKEVRRTTAIVGGLIVAHNAQKISRIIQVVGPLVAGSVAQRADTKRGEAFARNSFAESNGIRGVPSKTSKKRRDGSYNISSMGR